MQYLRRFLLWPIACLYGCVAAVRRCAYHRGWIKSYSFDIPTICVGNLRVGGTGKTPHTEYIASLLSQRFRVAILSRGYRRKSRGVVLAQRDGHAPTAALIGDEPLQYFYKLPSVAVAVAEKRAQGIARLQQAFPDLQAILLDDAYQHLQVKLDCKILVTPYDDLYVHDAPLPAGNLREFRSAARHADMIIVSKTPSSFTEQQRSRVLAALAPLPRQQVFFTTYHYQPLQPLTAMARQVAVDEQTTILAVTGIARPQSLYDELQAHYRQVVPVGFPDHHAFSADDLHRIVKLYRQYTLQENCIVVTTDKDAMRLQAAELENALSLLPVFVLPIEVKILFEQENQFNQTILSYVAKN